jgi:hypothetical protein
LSDARAPRRCEEERPVRPQLEPAAAARAHRKLGEIHRGMLKNGYERAFAESGVEPDADGDLAAIEL